MTDRIPQPTVGLAETVMALSVIPKKDRGPLRASLERLGADRGWDEDLRGLCVVLAAAIADLDNGVDLRDELDHVDALEVTNGSLAHVVHQDGDP